MTAVPTGFYGHDNPETEQWVDQDGTVHYAGSSSGTAREPEPVPARPGTGSRNHSGTGIPAETLNGEDVSPEPVPGSPPYIREPGTAPRYADVAALLDGNRPEPPAPVLLRREDDIALFYAGQVNLVFGDPEGGKTLLTCAAAVEALEAGRRVLVIDLDHNGVEAIVFRLLDMGAPEEALRDPNQFRYVEPEDRAHLAEVVADTKQWRPAVAVVDSIGELLPLLGLSSNSPDEFTRAHANVLKPLAMAGAAVLAIDHLPKNTETRASGPTGTVAKRRAIGGVAVRVTINEPFAPGRTGSAFLTVNKDRHGGLRQHCHSDGREPAAGLFIVDSRGDGMEWRIRPPQLGDTGKAQGVSDDDVAELDALDPPPGSVQDVQTRMKWRRQRAADALRAWRNGRPNGACAECGRAAPLNLNTRTCATCESETKTA
ncbi:MAG TPA: AAA family ATPase [Amycolatopsis sp.]|uniref:AAA family ATPase n=1 Tax=Amycolatopsis sp. TaxID=37632 RepID=UPI002B4727B2|nr:AAA family ATPase [Amycolatopsis sp.]HKS47374.1 AAA family ATPase [Amycolatopsis sp.]